VGALCATAALALTACGPTGPAAAGKTSPAASAKPSPAPFADLSGSDVVNKAMKTTRAVSSLRIKADTTDPEDGRVTLDMALTTKGDCTGTVTLDAGSALLTKVGPTLYMKFDEKLVRAQSGGDSKASQEAAVDLLAGHWVKTSATSSDAKDFSSFCDLDSLLSHFKTTDSAARKGPLSTVDGTRTITLTEARGKDKDTMYVATEGQPYIVRIVAVGSDPGSVTFSDFDQPVDAKAPTGRHVLDLDKLTG
jgi:hypothetical protein